MTLEIPNLADAVETIITTVTYPFVQFLRFLTSIVYLIWDTFHALFGAFMHLYDVLSNFLLSFFTGMFPTTITGILLTCVLFVVMLRIYFFLKDVSILGNKI